MTPSKPVKVLVVDDSETDRLLLSFILTRDSRTQVVGAAANGEEAIDLIRRLEPHVVLMDVTMPGAGGLAATRRIMETQPVPIIICSGLHGVDPTLSFRAVEAGALTIVCKPRGIGSPEFPQQAKALVDMACAMSEVRVLRRRPRPWRNAGEAASAGLSAAPRLDRRLELVVVGASTGGPPALRALLGALVQPFAPPVLIVQHIAAGFVTGMADWLQQSCGMPVGVARHGESPRPGHGYLAPDHHHLLVDRQGRMMLEADDPDGGHRPAVDRLFHSVVASGRARFAAGVLLTGMGEDGAAGLCQLREAGALTLAQDAKSCVVNGMPAEAIRRGGALHVLPPEAMARVLCETATAKWDANA